MKTGAASTDYNNDFLYFSRYRLFLNPAINTPLSISSSTNTLI